MNPILAKLLKLKTPLKGALTAALLLAIGGLYFFFFYGDLAAEIANSEAGQVKLKAEKEQYEQRKKEYQAYRGELSKLQEEQRELLKALPKKAEIPSFIANIQEQAELSGLEVLSITIEAEASEELYVKIPVAMEVRGSFHALTKFFKNVSELRRIVNIENFGMSLEAAAAATDNGPPKLKVKFIAATFRYVDKGGGT
jgi:type IV pilus assembly protein PilO